MVRVKNTQQGSDDRPLLSFSATEEWTVGQVRAAVASSEHYREDCDAGGSGVVTLIYAGKILKDQERLSHLTRGSVCR